MINKIEISRINLESRKGSVAKWKIPEEEKVFILRFLEELELGRINKGRKLCKIRIAKYIDGLHVALRFFNKKSDELILKDIEVFEKAMSSGTLKTFKGTPYMHNSQVDIKRLLRIYLRWRLGEAKAVELAGWFDTRSAVKTPDYLSEQQVEKLLRSCKSNHERFLIAILFDSGARASEFHNIRYEDIKLPNGKENYVKLTLKEEYSKTKGRVISLYWKHSLNAVKDFLEERLRQGINEGDAFYNYTYNSARAFLIRLGKRVLGKNIYFHLFRHSSATYYATKLNRQQLCYRYGWRFSSGMPDVYISRAGMNDKELDEKFTSSSIEEIKSLLERQVLMNKIISEKQQQMEEELNQRRKLDPLLNEFLDSPTIKQKLAKLGANV